MTRDNVPSRMPERRFTVPRSLYPYEPHWLGWRDTHMHYVDVGEGVPVVMLHGNPTWSFLYRNVIAGLSQTCRCIAPDYPGFGYSEHPPGYGYTPPEHGDWIGRLVDSLGLDRFVLLMQDWGGPIGLSVALQRPDRLAGLVFANTWCWPPNRMMWSVSKFLGSRLGRYLILQHNLFVERILPMSIRDPAAKSGASLDAYRAPFPNPAFRMGTWVFPRAINGQATWLAGLESNLGLFRDVPVDLVVGDKAPFFGHQDTVQRWLGHFPRARLARIQGAGHYIQEDAPDAVIDGVRSVLEKL